jgi:hypothetical protein
VNNKSRNRLGEKDTASSSRDVGLSPTFSTISKKKKQVLWNQLRKVDRQLSKLLGYIDSITLVLASDWYNRVYPERIAKIIKLDLKRKEIRNKLKGYGY